MIGAGLAAAVAWNLVTWRLGLPSSSGHALVGGLVGASLVAGGIDAVNWGGLDGWHPVGVFGTLIALAVSPLLGALGGTVAIRGAAPARPARDAALARAGPRGRVGDVRRARLQPRRERRAEVGRRDRRAAARGRADRHAWRLRHGPKLVARRRSPSARHSADGGSFAPWAAASTASSRSRAWPARPLLRASSSVPRSPGRRYRRPRSSPPRSSASAWGDGAGTTCTGRSCARWASPGSSRCRSPLRSLWRRSGSGELVA